jgi:hypothetical protein
MAGPFFVLSCFWIGWTAAPPHNGTPTHWAVPVCAGIPFGIGFLLLFMALLNYLVDAYGFFSASAMAAASSTRSTFGAVLPFAARPMYDRLGVNWACSLLGFIALVLAFVPFVFIRFGPWMRSRSEFCQYLAQQEKEGREKKVNEHNGDEEMSAGVTKSRSSTALTKEDAGVGPVEDGLLKETSEV